MTRVFFIVTIYLFLCSSCEKNDLPPGVVWKTKIEEGTSDNSRGYIHDMIFFQNKIIVPAQKNGEKFIKSLNVEDGNTEWEWNDWLDFDKSDGLIVYPHLYENSYVFYTGRRAYILDFKNGKTLWKSSMLNDISLTSYSTSVENKIFATGNEPNSNNSSEYVWTLYKLDVKYPEKNFQSFIINESGKVEYRVDYHSPYKNLSGEICLLFPYSIPKDNKKLSWGEYKNLQWFLGAYNVAQKRYEYKDSTKTGFFDKSIMHENKIYAVVGPKDWDKDIPHKIFRYDPITRKKDWEIDGTEPNQNKYGASGYQMDYYDGKFFTCGNEFVICIDAETGRVLWRHYEGGGNAQSPYKFLNGVAYWTNAGYLFAVDVNTGEILLGEGKKGHPENHHSWAISIGLVPPTSSRKGLIIVHDYKNAYAFEALR